MKETMKGMRFVCAALLTLATALGFAASAADVGFAVPFPEWRTPLQIVDKTVADEMYNPLTIFTTNDVPEISFGWTDHKAGQTAMPMVSFEIVDAEHRTVVKWTETSATTKEGFEDGLHWSGHMTCNALKFLEPGDYMLTAELDPSKALADPNRADNFACFRFAIRDESVRPTDVLSGQQWKDLSFVKGNDFAQAPFATSCDTVANKDPDCPIIQFGPYVPMDGIVGGHNRKKPLDLVIAVDATGSMSGCINGLLQNIGVFIDQLLRGDPSKNLAPIEDLRIKLVSFGDDKSDRNSWGWFAESEFSSDVNYLKRQLSGGMFFEYANSTRFGGGGNGAESSFDALWYIAKEWVPNTAYGIRQTTYVTSSNRFRPVKEASRAVILFTDEPAWDTRYHDKWPEMTAIGCANKKPDDLAALLNSEKVKINLHVVTDDSLRGWSYGFAQYQDLVDTMNKGKGENDPENTYIHKGVRSLASFTQSFDSLRALAETVSEGVPTIVVEPSFGVVTKGFGTLSFKWINETSAGTNNTFTFIYPDPVGGTNAEMRCTSTNAWIGVELPRYLNETDHRFQWTYGKLGDQGDGCVPDCGRIADFKWDPIETHLAIDPESRRFECEGGESNVVEVSCNANWTATVDDACKGWVSVTRGSSGNGNGTLVYKVAPNESKTDDRSGSITFSATDPTTKVTITRVHTVVQEKSPYKPTKDIQIIDIGVKPRWPWNSYVDIDFRVILPENSTEAVKLQIKGQDKQGVGLGFTGLDADSVRIRGPQNIAEINTSSCIGFNPNTDMTKETSGIVFLCKTSGLYRITWDVGNWNTKAWDQQTYRFHTPEFCVKFIACGVEGHAAKVECTSDPVRVDTRVGNGKGERGSQCGGVIITGREMIGHPQGRIDPFPWNSSAVADGRVFLNELFPEEYRTDVMTNLSFVVLNSAHVAGEVITNDTSWAASVVHVVRDNVFVAPEATLTIEDGAVVKFCDHTKTFVRYLGKGADNIGRWNIVVKGAYMTSAYDPTVGGDTLCEPSVTNHWRIADDFTKRFIMESFLGQNDSTSDICIKGTKGIYPMQMLTVASVTTNQVNKSITYSYVASAKWVRVYSRCQPYGNLPRPVGSGEEFLGWYTVDPWGTIQRYVNTEYSLAKVEGKLVKLSESPNPGTVDSIGVPQVVSAIYAMSDVPVAGRTNPWPKADAGLADIKLSFGRTYYNGRPQKPDIQEVKVGEAVIPAGNYTATWSNAGSTDVGVYSVTLDFLYDYTNSPTAYYSILQREATDVTVSFDPAYYVYQGSPFAAKPQVIVTANLDGQMKTLSAATDYDVGWSAGDWTSVGKYRATVQLKGNYMGTATGVFEIKENEDLAVRIYQKGEEDKLSARIADLNAKSKYPRVLYLTGNDVSGNEGVATRALIDLLKNDLGVRQYVLDNFVCKYDDYATDGSNKCATAYAPGFSGPLAFMGALGVLDQNQCVQSTNGYLSASALLKFLQDAKIAPEDASAAQVTWSPVTNFTANGQVQRPAVSAVNYCGTTIPSDNYNVISTLPGETAPVESKESETYEAKVEFDPSKPLSPYAFGLKGVARDVCTFVIKVSLPPNPQPSEIPGILATWQDTNLTAKVMTPEAYAKFRRWVERMGGLSNEATYNELVNSQYAYISSRVSEILAEAQLLQDPSQVELKITEFKAGSPCELAFELKLGGTPQELQAAKEALAGMVLVGAELGKMAHPDPTAIEATPVEQGKKVKLTVPSPVDAKGNPTPSGFMKMTIE